MVYRRLLRIFVMGFGGHPTSRNIGRARPAKRDSAKQDGGVRSTCVVVLTSANRQYFPDDRRFTGKIDENKSDLALI